MKRQFRLSGAEINPHLHVYQNHLWHEKLPHSERGVRAWLEAQKTLKEDSDSKTNLSASITISAVFYNDALCIKGDHHFDATFN